MQQRPFLYWIQHWSLQFSNRVLPSSSPRRLAHRLLLSLRVLGWVQKAWLHRDTDSAAASGFHLSYWLWMCLIHFYLSLDRDQTLLWTDGLWVLIWVLMQIRSNCSTEKHENLKLSKIKWKWCIFSPICSLINNASVNCQKHVILPNSPWQWSWSFSFHPHHLPC